MKNQIWGIDPGAEGALAVICQNKIQVVRFKNTTDDELNDFIQRNSNRAKMCFYESVGAVPGDSAKTMFSFGNSFGFVRGLLIAHRVNWDHVSPQKWQTKISMGKSYGGKSARKNAHKERAQSLWPEHKVTLDMCDAMLIAHYCQMTHGQIKPPLRG